MARVELNTVEVDGVKVFYRSAGPPTAPVLLLLHGFPSSSFQFRDLIPLLASKFRVLAPDLPGFGFTEVPAERKYQYTFDNLSLTIEAFLGTLKVDKFSVYIFDYGVRYLPAFVPARTTLIKTKRGLHTVTHGVPHRRAAPAARDRDHLAERECVRGGARRRVLGAAEEVLGRAGVLRELARRASTRPVPAARPYKVAVHARRARNVAHARRT